MLGLPAAHAAGVDAAGQAVTAPLEHYQGWRDAPLLDWRAANARVGEAGGWRAYARESQPDGDPAGHGDPPHHGHAGEGSR
jgi:hypothetical protein